MFANLQDPKDRIHTLDADPTKYFFGDAEFQQPG